MFNHQFHLLSQEGSLTQTALLTGLDFLSKADHDNKGGFYTAFFQLSIGLERLMKIAVILDYKVHNELKNPTNADLRCIGHGLINAYEKCKQLASDRGMNMSGWFDAGRIEHDILQFLSEFSTGARYYNLNQLAGTKKHDDPLAQWSVLHKRVADTYISFARQEKINMKAVAHCDKFGLYGWERGIDGQWRATVDITFLHALFKNANRYCVWTMIRIMRPFYFLLSALCKENHTLEERKGMQEIIVPYMYEFFPFFLCDRSTSTSRKNWITVLK
jgi:hypothetical protein